MSMHETTLAPGQLLRSVHMEKSYLGKAGLPDVVEQVTPLTKLPRGKEKLIWTVTGVRPYTKAKLTPGLVSCPGAMSCSGIMWTGPKHIFELH